MQLPNNSIPVAIGAAIGVVAISIISLANGWVIPTSKVDAKIDEMTISVQASICAARAEDFLKESNSTANLEGYQAEANDKRQVLARSYATPMMGADGVDSNVIDACARMLNKSRS